MLFHTYASLDEGKQYLRDEGVAWGAGSTNDARALGVLEGVSRRVDDWTQRSAFGSGFGPRTGTNRYDGDGSYLLDFRDDLITTTSITTRSGTAAATTSTLVADTDYYLLNQRGQYEPGPYRSAILHGQGIARFGIGLRVTDWVGSWGYEDRRRAFTATLTVADTTSTSATVSSGTEFSAGQTILVGTEQLYIRAIASTTLTVERGVNGTTAAAHAAAAVSRYLYDSRATDATLRLFLRRWRGRDGGADGTDNGGDLGTIMRPESEETILRRSVGELRLGARVALVSS